MTVKSDELGEFEKVPIRDYWQNEAHEFTPWLAKHIHLLGDAIGLELEDPEQESEVGDFSADIVCVSTDNRPVIVENQFGKTDHDHLGKLLTYAAGKDAAGIVWIAEHFRDEHRAAIDWLNEKTSSDIHAFGVQIELWRIGGSVPAPKFNVVSKPNDWTKAIRPTGEMTDTKKMYLKFWMGFRDVMERNNGKVRPTSPMAAKWMKFSFGRGGLHLNTSASVLRNRIGVALIIRKKAFYPLLLQQRKEVESEVGQQLEWRELPDHKQSQVRLFRKKCDISNEKQWGEYYSWLHEHLEKFHAAFHKRVQALDPSDLEVEDEQDEDD